jgi:ribonuclease HI
MKATVYSDGGARPCNPGHAAFAVIVEVGGEEHVIARYIGWHSNNVAEYYGFITGAKYALQLGASEVTFYTDSQLIANQVSGKWQIKGPDLRLLAHEAIDLMDKFSKWKIKWTGRENNQKADQYCTNAIYFGMKRNPFFKRNGNRKAEEIDPFNGRATINILLPRSFDHQRKHARILISSINADRSKVSIHK